MKQYFYITLLIVLIASCNSASKETDVVAENGAVYEPDTVQLETEQINKLDTIRTFECHCAKAKDFKDIYKTHISFHKRNWDMEKQKFQKQNIDSLIKEIESIRLIGFDTIPIELGVLENIEKALIDSRNGIKGLDIFPKLKIVMFWGSRISINENEKWLSKLEYLRMEKSQITNLSSIGLFKNLMQLEIFHSGFNGLTPNFDSLKCLNNLNIRAYRGDVIELGKIDLRKMPCLKYLYLQDAFNTLKGIPDNIKTSNLDYIYVNNVSMTEIDKQMIEEYKSR